MQIQLTDARSSMSRGLASFEVKKLSTIMKELGHKWVDVLKIDIEGNEWPVLEGMIADKSPFMFTQMQVRRHPACLGSCACSRCWGLSHNPDSVFCEAANCLQNREKSVPAHHLYDLLHAVVSAFGVSVRVCAAPDQPPGHRA